MKMNESGLTLLELIVALLVSSLLVLLLGVGLDTGIGAAGRTRDRAEETRDRAAMEAVLRASIGEALAIGDYDDREAALRFEGVADALAVVGVGPLGPAPRRLSIDAAGRLAVGGRFGGDAVFDAGRGATFSYYGRRRGEDAEAWHGSWTHQPELPRLVRLTLPDGGEIAIRPRTERAPFR